MRALTMSLLLGLAVAVLACGDDDSSVPDDMAPGTPFAGGAASPPPTPRDVVPDCAQALPPTAASPGERHTVAGTIASIDTAKDARGGMTLLEFGEEAGGPRVAIAIASGARDAFPGEMSDLYLGKDVCVNGVVIEVAERRVIFVDRPAEIIPLN